MEKTTKIRRTTEGNRLTFYEWIKHHHSLELCVFSVFLSFLICMWLFAAIADQVYAGAVRQFDISSLAALRHPDDPAIPLGPGWMIHAARDITALGGLTVLILVTLFTVGIFLQNGRMGTALLVSVANFGGMLAVFVLKLFFDRQRPDFPHFVDVASLSFPSGHAMLSAVVYLTLGALIAESQPRRTLKIYFLSAAMGLTILIGLSRIYLGVHYPTDVLAGWTTGLGWALICLFCAVFLRYRGTLNPGAE
jgi:undecaprenyl-diphosphatase